MEEQNQKIVRCAIYTRKSSEEGLNMEFNSLDAQREAGEAYIASQKGEGMICLPAHYDDGGFTGGNMERPALKKLLNDIENDLIDCIIVYKVDRLSRSLLDFAELIGIFDRHNVTFVSVTQQFNTTTSMGRLTLNILLSFAQFEREIIGERIRDKIAAAKKKGKYTGGHPILGYDSKKAKLYVNPDEAKIVKHIYKRFIILRSPMKLARELNGEGIRNKTWTSVKGKVHHPRPWNKQSVYTILNNRKYLGEITHFDKIYPGEHEAIIDRKTWDQVQQIFMENGHKRARETRCKTPSMLKGILRCGHCDSSMGITYAKKNEKTYRYYQCLSASKNGRDTCPLRAVPAGNVEDVIVRHIREILRSPEAIAKAELTAGEMINPPDPVQLIKALQDVDGVWEHLYPAEQARICRLLVEKAIINGDNLEIHLRDCGITTLAQELLEQEGAA